VINTVLPDASLQLGKLAENVSKAMDKIATREKHINSHYEHLILDYRAMQEKLQGAEQKCAPTAPIRSVCLDDAVLFAARPAPEFSSTRDH
jgi:outer membrane murein-binding lipoprotein Lpp